MQKKQEESGREKQVTGSQEGGGQAKEDLIPICRCLIWNYQFLIVRYELNIFRCEYLEKL